MSLPTNQSAYEDCYAYFDRAIATTTGKGIRIPVASRSDAQILRLRLNQSRVLLRRESTQIYDRTDPRYNKSDFDAYRVTIQEPATGPDEPGYWVYIERWAQTVSEDIEEL